jgi:hypothetical protein
MLGKSGMMFAKAGTLLAIVTALDTRPRPAASVFRFGEVRAGKLSEGNAFSTVAMIVGSDVRLVSNCLTLFSCALCRVRTGSFRLAAGLSNAALMLGSKIVGRVNPGSRALIAATQCNSAITHK